MFSPSDAKQVEDGDKVVLFVGKYDPPTFDYFRAIEALYARAGVNHVWLCPITQDEHAKNMASILAADFCREHRQVSVVLTKHDSAKNLVLWARSRYPQLRFCLAYLPEWQKEDDSERTFLIKLGSSGDAVPEGTDLIALEKFLPAPPDIKARIKSGIDEARNFVPAIWNYIQKNKLYRG